MQPIVRPHTEQIADPLLRTGGATEQCAHREITVGRHDDRR